MKRHIIAFTALILCLAAASDAKVRLPSVLNDGMVLQRDEPITIWGWADACESFTVKWKEVEYPVKAGEDGKWKIVLPECNAGGAIHADCRRHNIDRHTDRRCVPMFRAVQYGASHKTRHRYVCRRGSSLRERQNTSIYSS